LIYSNISVIAGDIQGADVLIGMDIISLVDFAITNANKETNFLRFPSFEAVDFYKRDNINL